MESTDTILCVTCKILADKRLLELIRENENLKLQLFWRDHDLHALKSAMTYFNSSRGWHRCDCKECRETGRYDRPYLCDAPSSNAYWRDTLETPKCMFKERLEKILVELGLTFGVPDNRGKEIVQTPCHGVMMDSGLHFEVSAGRQAWTAFQYGCGIYKAQHVDDPAIVKLKRLFAILKDMNTP